MARITKEARVQVRIKLLQSGATHFAARGLAGANINQISVDAGFAKGTVYNYFASKEALVAGLCERMLVRFEQELQAVSSADDQHPGAFPRAYLASTVTEDGKPADNSARLMAGILATLGSDSAHLETVRARFARWHARLEADGIDETTATLVGLAADGLWLSALLGLRPLDADAARKVTLALRRMTRG